MDQVILHTLKKLFIKRDTETTIKAIIKDEKWTLRTKNKLSEFSREAIINAMMKGCTFIRKKSYGKSKFKVSGAAARTIALKIMEGSFKQSIELRTPNEDLCENNHDAQ